MRTANRSLLHAALFAAALGALASCTAVRFNEQARLRSVAMSGEESPLRAEMRGHVFSPREGAVGGFSTVGAGGCGCH